MYNTALALHQSLAKPLHIRTGGRTRDDLDQLAGNDGLSGSVVENLELIDHVAGVLRCIVHGVAAGGLFGGVALGKSPEEAVGECVLTQVAEDLVVDLECGVVGYEYVSRVLSCA